jgi:transaldolase
LAALGQSIWYDNVQRSLLTNGEIAQMITEDSLTGLTSNPTIFNKAISQSADYDQALAELLSQNPQAKTIDLYEALAIADIQTAADLLRPVYDRTNGVDGYASPEVSPFGHDTTASIEEARRLRALNRPNVLTNLATGPGYRHHHFNRRGSAST